MATSKVNEMQVGGTHYQGKCPCPNCGYDVQHWDRAWAMNYDCFQYIITKWVERWRDKGGLQDLYKAKHAIEKYISVIEAKQNEGDATPGYVDQG